MNLPTDWSFDEPLGKLAVHGVHQEPAPVELPQMNRLLLLSLALSLPRLVSAADQVSLAKALTFHAGYDGTVDAAYAAGDKRMHTATTMARTDGKAGNHRASVTIVPGGRYGDALRIEKNDKEVIYYPAAKNFDWRPDDWSGTLSMWIRLTPEQDLQPGFADPIQITDKKWDDASFFFDFSKDENPRHFRLGVFSDLKVWNPKNTPWEQIPVAARPMVVVEKPPFRRDRWTHVVATWSHYNTGNEAAEGKMYLDGKLQGTLKGRQTISWDPDKTAIMLALSYIGDIDDLAVFNRALSADEVKALFELPGGVADLHR